MSMDVAFESAEEITQKLARYEQLFANRYTEAEEGFRRCLANAEKVLQVPVIDPWPPRMHHRGRYDDWGGGGGGRRRGPRGRRRDNRYHRDHYSHHYYDDRPPPPPPPPPGHWGYSHRSPREDYRERSPRRPLSPHSHHYHRHGSSSPHPYPPPPHPPPPPPHHLSPHPPPPHYHPHSRSPSPAPPPHNRSPYSDKDKPPHDSSSLQETAPPSLPHHLNLDLGEREDKVAPSASDVQDILSFAHTPQSNVVTAENLRQVKQEGIKMMKSRGDSGKSGKKLHSSGHSGGGRDQDRSSDSGQSSGLLVTHGKTKEVSTSYLLGSHEEGEGPPPGMRTIRRRRVSSRTGKSESEEEEGRSGGTRGIEKMRGEAGGGGDGGLVMRVDKKFCHSNSESSILSHSVPNTPSSDLTPTFTSHSSLPHLSTTGIKEPSTRYVEASPIAPPIPVPSEPTISVEDTVKEKKRKKKKKKKKKSSANDREEETIDEQYAPIKLKITLGKS